MRFDYGGRLAAIAGLTAACCFPGAHAQNIDFNAVEIQTVKVADGLYVLMGGAAQGNIAVSVGGDGVFLVDSMYPDKPAGTLRRQHSPPRRSHGRE
jgi:hypothetical protein